MHRARPEHVDTLSFLHSAGTNDALSLAPKGVGDDRSALTQVPATNRTGAKIEEIFL
jgi:hypothetical protein